MRHLCVTATPTAMAATTGREAIAVSVVVVIAVVVTIGIVVVTVVIIAGTIVIIYNCHHCVHLCLNVCMWVHSCAFVCGSVHDCACACVHVCICLHVCACVYAQVCVYVCICACVCMRVLACVCITYNNSNRSSSCRYPQSPGVASFRIQLGVALDREPETAHRHLQYIAISARIAWVGERLFCNCAKPVAALNRSCTSTNAMPK